MREVRIIDCELVTLPTPREHQMAEWRRDAIAACGRTLDYLRRYPPYGFIEERV